MEILFGDTAKNCTAVSLVQLSDGKIAAGANCIDSLSNSNAELFLFDTAHTLLHSFAFTTGESIGRLSAFPNDEILIAGTITDSTGNQDGLLMRVDTSGSVKWKVAVGRPVADESFQGVCISPDGSVIAGGSMVNFSGAGKTAYLGKVDSAGNFLWDKIFNFSYNNYIDAVVQIDNGSLLLSGDRQTPSLNYTNYTICTDDTGHIIWDLPLPNPYNNGCKNDLLTSNGDVMIVGESSTATNLIFDPAITRLDTSGSFKWSYIYNGSSTTTDALFDITEPFPEEYIAAGYGGNPVNNNADLLMIRIDSSGNEMSRNYIGDTAGFDIGYAIITDKWKRGCYIAGTTVRNSMNRGYLVFTGLMGITANIDDAEKAGISAYPIPASDYLHINSGNTGPISVTIYTLTGEKILSESINGHSPIPVGSLQNGFYILNILSGNKSGSVKLLIGR